MIWLNIYSPGLLLALALALVASWLGGLFPLIGGPVFGIILGILINNTVGKPKNTLRGITFTSKKILQWASRTTMIIPISLVYALIVSAQKKREAGKGEAISFSFRRIFPWFIMWFLFASLLNTLGLFEGSSLNYLNLLGKFMIVMAISAIGLSSDIKEILKAGVKPLVLGITVWFVVTMVSIVVQFVVGQI